MHMKILKTNQNSRLNKKKLQKKNMYIKTASEWQDGTGDQHLYRYIFHLVSAVVQSQSTSVHTIHSC